MGKRPTKLNLATQRTDLHAPPPGGANGSGGNAVGPSKRVVGKTPDGGVNPPPPKKLKKGHGDDVGMPPYPPFELCWGNFKEVMKYYQLTEQDTTKLLCDVVGPDPRGSSFWTKYADRIKQEQVERTTPPPDLPPVLPDNQLGDPTICPPEVPTTEPEDDPNDGDYVDEGEEGEEESLDGDPIDENIEVPANGGGGDDQDSPASGAAMVTVEVKETVCAPQPNEVVEPTRVPVVVNEAVEKAKGLLAESPVATVPTPLTRKSTRYIQTARRAPDDAEVIDSRVDRLSRQQSFRLLDGLKTSIVSHIILCFDWILIPVPSKILVPLCCP